MAPAGAQERPIFSDPSLYSVHVCLELSAQSSYFWLRTSSFKLLSQLSFSPRSLLKGISQICLSLLSLRSHLSYFSDSLSSLRYHSSIL